MSAPMPVRLDRFSRLVLGIALSLLCLAACQPEEKKEEGVPVGIVGINHTKTYIADFYVNGVGNGNIPSIGNGGGGGSTTCCLVLPRHYAPGLSAKVRWNHTEDKDNWKETIATVLPYQDGVGRAWVNFLPDDRVVILVTEMAPWHENYRSDYRSPSHPAYRGWEAEFPRQETSK